MKKKIGIILIILIAIIIVIQFVPYGRNHSNPITLAEPKWDRVQTKELFSRSCADCHSNQTTWPWYSNIAPVSWLVQKDVDKGRAKFNVSELGRSAENEVDEAAEAIQEGKMPMTAYLIMHPDANLSSQEKADLTRGLSATFSSKSDKGREVESERDEQDDD